MLGLKLNHVSKRGYWPLIRRHASTETPVAKIFGALWRHYATLG